jgi:hypothetical protein
MNEIAGIRYIEARFDKDGVLQNSITLPAATSDLFVISHGWNREDQQARELYRGFFESFSAVARPAELPDRKFAILGVLWPSKKFDESVAVSTEGGVAEGSVSLSPHNEVQAQRTVEEKLERMNDLFSEPAQHRTIEEVKALLPELESKESARRAFADKIRSLLDPSSANDEDASRTFFKTDGNELMKDFKILEEDLDAEVAGGAAMPLGVGTTPAAGTAAGLTDSLSGFNASALNLLNYTTYYLMKERAGTVGKNGVAKLIDRLASQVQRIYLIGHSFGGRLVTAAAANSQTGKLRGLTLLQAAFSHNGFSKKKKGYFRSVVDNRRVNGPILITYTKNDKAVGIAYPLASRINGDKTAALGDENDAFGAVGRNGAQQMEEGERILGTLLSVGGVYTLEPGKLLNLESSQFITDHGDVTGLEIAHAVWSAVKQSM